MPVVKLEDERVIDFSFCPDFTVQAEEEEEKKSEEIASVDLQKWH